jgi:hypothetical protein
MTKKASAMKRLDILLIYFSPLRYTGAPGMITNRYDDQL